MQGGYAGITMNASRNVTINNIRVHHFGYDGLTVRDAYCLPSPWANIIAVTLNLIINKSVFTYNARNNMTWAGGSGVTVYASEFSHAGQGRYYSKPAAGLDIEYESSSGGWGYPNSNGVFNNCRFEYNLLYGMSSGDIDNFMSRNYQFNHCTFIGQYESIHNSYRRETFNDCYFVGTVISHYGAPVANPSDTSFNHNQTKFVDCIFHEEHNVPGMGRRSFQKTDDELTGCPIPFHGHLFLINIIGSRTELTRCYTHTNFTMLDAVLFGGVPSYNNIKMDFTDFYNHGLNGCNSEHELSSLSNVTFIDSFNAQVITQIIDSFNPGSGLPYYRYLEPRNGPLGSWPADEYFGVSNLYNTGYFNQQYCCTPATPGYSASGEWPLVNKYAHPADPNPVNDLFSYDNIVYQYTTTSGIQSFCIDPPFRIKGKTKQEVKSGLVIYPNPALKTLNVENVESGTIIIVSNILGEEIIKNISDGNPTLIDIDKLRPGIYFVHTDGGQSRKFVKQ